MILGDEKFKEIYGDNSDIMSGYIVRLSELAQYLRYLALTLALLVFLPVPLGYSSSIANVLSAIVAMVFAFSSQVIELLQPSKNPKESEQTRWSWIISAEDARRQSYPLVVTFSFWAFVVSLIRL
jgi:hypothetical protein